ncbi:DUF2752 domain-containing protein [Aeromicrobium ginsengisoli]|uniref:DUF2752 domain-containing protein n=1 Tax=Aeromicrobium ginsengisoli TaxID=363867 RepID=UPI001CB6CA2A|nr:DUF2752 domain-containing protein [Aeromicrobium ginsengisoli]
MTITPRAEIERRVAASGLRAPALVGAAGLGAAVLLHLRDPHDSGTYGYCPFLTLTGKPCPGCGGLRAVNDLTRGDLVGALSSNLLAVVLVGALAAAWVLWVVRRVRGKVDSMITLNLPAGLALIAVVLVFGVVRNTPWGSWLAP